MLALFDLDSLFFDADTASLWSAFLRRQLGRPASTAQPARLLGSLKQGMLAWERYLQLTMAPLAGLSLDEGERLAGYFVSQHLLPAISPEALALLECHHRRQDRLVLLSPAALLWLKPVAQWLDIDTVVGLEPELRRQHYTGRPLREWSLRCREDFRRYVCEAGWHPREAYGYGASGGDLPLLEGVCHPQVIHPDPFLRHIARARGWPIRCD